MVKWEEIPNKKKEAGNLIDPRQKYEKEKDFICNYSLLCTGNNITRKCEKYVVRF